jgi:hypothetical protein
MRLGLPVAIEEGDPWGRSNGGLVLVESRCFAWATPGADEREEADSRLAGSEAGVVVVTLLAAEGQPGSEGLSSETRREGTLKIWSMQLLY